MKLLEMLENGTSLDSRMYCILIAYSVRIRDISRANSVFHEMKSAKLIPPDAVYNLLIYANGKEGDLDKCTQLFEEMKLHMMEPNARSHNTLPCWNGNQGISTHVHDSMTR